MSRLDELGFDKLTLITDNQVSQLKKLFDLHFAKEAVSGMLVTHNQNQVALNLEISQAIAAIIGEDIQKAFPDFDFFIAHFVVKGAENQNAFQLHQDWNIVDEKHYKSYQIWIPLALSYPENGGMHFIPRSHLFHSLPRSGSLGKPLLKVNKDIYPYLSYFRMFAGEAAVFHNALFHGSFSNATPEPRVAVLVNIVQKNAPTEYFHFNESKHSIDVYPIDATTLLTHLHDLEKGKLPLTGLPSRTIEAKQKPNYDFTIQDFISWIHQDRKTLQLPHDYEFKKTQLLKNSETEKTINDRGYEVINFLTEKEISTIKAIFDDFFPDRKKFKGRYNSMDNLSMEDRIKAHQFIQQIVKSRLNFFFKDYECPISILYSKRNDAVDDTDWHTDPFFVPNPHFNAIYGLWCPLLDIGKDNGVLQVIPYSHRLSNKLNSPNFKWSLADKRRKLDKYAAVQDLKAGQAILYDARLIHGSAPNISDIERDCIVLRVTAKNSQYMCVAPGQEDAHQFYIYKQNADFFFGNNVSKHSETPNTGSKAGRYYPFDESISEQEMKAFFEQRMIPS